MLTLFGVRGIIYKSTRYGTETKAKVARHLKFVLSKLNIEPIKKRMCGSSAFKARDQVKLISFNNKSQIGSSIYLTKRNCSYSRKNEESEWDNTLVYRMSLTKFWRRRWQFIEVKKFYWRVWSWLRTNAGGMPNTCKSNGDYFGNLSGERVSNA